MPSAYGIVVHDGYAYVARGWGPALQIFDVSTPSLPRPTGFITQTPGGEARDVAILATHAYVANGNDILVVDVADPSAPSTVTTIPGDALHVSVRGATLYAFGSDVRAIDISRPASPRFVAECALPGPTSAGLAATDSWICTAYYNDSRDRNDFGVVHMLLASPPNPDYPRS